MHLYKITVNVAPEDGQQPFVEWVGTQADCARVRKKWTAEDVPRINIATEEVDVPTDKQGLLRFLNGGSHA